MCKDRFTGSVVVRVGPDHRKAVPPDCWLQVHDPSVNTAVLKMQEPPIARGSVDKSSLMRPVDRSFALRENNFFLIRPVNILRSQYELPSGGHAAGRGRNVIEAVQLVKLRAFDGGVGVMAIEYHY